MRKEIKKQRGSSLEMLGGRWTVGHGLGFALMVPSLVRYGENFLTNHSCAEYMKRFTAFATKRGGNKVFLNDVYKNEAQMDKLLEDWSKS